MTRGTTLLHALLTQGVSERSNKRILCNGSTRRTLAVPVRARSSETMFPRPRPIPSQLTGLSVRRSCGVLFSSLPI